MWTIVKERSCEAPLWVNQLLLDTFGVNDFGDPLYRVVWGMAPVRRVSKVGGGYEDQCGKRPGWWIQRWVSPLKWGSPEHFRIINKDPANDQILFPYPEYGEYEVVKDLGDKPIDWELFHSTIPFLEQISKLTKAQVEAYKDRQKELKNKREVDEIADRMMDTLPSRYGPVSYGRGGCRTSLLDRKIEEIQKVWNRYDKNQLTKLNRKGMGQGQVEQ